MARRQSSTLPREPIPGRVLALTPGTNAVVPEAREWRAQTTFEFSVRPLLALAEATIPG